MTTTHIGTLALSAALPGPAVALDQSYIDLQSQVTALNAQLSALATLPPLPGYPTILARAEATVTAITEAIAIGLPAAPSIAANITALTAVLAAVNAALSLVLAQTTALAAAGVDVYAFSGPRNTMGSELATALGSSTTQAWGMVLVTTTSATWTAMQSIFKTTP